MKNLFFLILMMLTMTSNAQTKQRPIVAPIGKVFSGNEGLTIITCRIGKEENNEYLIKFEGIDHPWNNKIFIAKISKFKNNSVENNQNMEYTIQYSGKPYKVLTTQGDQPGYYKAFLMPYANQQIEHRLVYNEAESKYLNTERLLTEYLEQ